MLRFLRHIRKKLLKENKVRTYLVYAAGEIFLVVIGILIALQINNWNEQRKLDNERFELLTSLHSDFIVTRSRLEQSLSHADNIVTRMEKFLTASYKENESIPIDTLKHWGGAAFDLAQIEPLLGTYNEAVSTGRISLINDVELMETIAEFLLAYRFYGEHIRLSGDMFYHGSIWELRKEVGTLQVLGKAADDAQRNRIIYEDAFPMSDYEFRAYIAQPHVFAAFENFLTIHYNIKETFREMDKQAQNITIKLEEMLAEY